MALRPLLRALVVVAAPLAVLAWPAPPGLALAGQRVLAVATLAIALWGLELVPAGVTGMVVILALVLTGAVPGLREALAGFAEPIVYFLVGVLTIGLAVSQSGLAERVAHVLVRRAGGRPGRLYGELLLAFPLLTLLLPSATTRTGILVHVYDQALTLGGVATGAPLAKAVMLALNSVNRLASTILLTGGITPVVAAGLIGGLSWTRWLTLMSAPYLALLAAAAAAIFLRYRRGFAGALAAPPAREPQPLSGAEWRTGAITAGAAALWLTDAWHGWHPAVPALLAWACLLMPGLGVLAWSRFERDLGWASVFVIAASLSLAQAIQRSGAGAWLASGLVRATPMAEHSAVAVVLALLVAAALVRLLVPNITGFLATTIPVAMSVGETTGLSPVLCGLVVTIAGDAVLYYPAQSASSLVVYQRGHLTAGEIFAFGLWMTVVAAVVVLAVALPYWALVGEPLVAGR
jgi:anion transporter